MPKIAMIGAGSLIFCKTLAMDILATDALKGSEICLMSRTRPKLDRMEAFLKEVIRENELPAKVWSTLDRREALKDADYVICMVQVGGVEAFGLDYEIPLKYGVDQCIGDSLGPGGVFRGLRTMPVLADLVRDMEELAPNARAPQLHQPDGRRVPGDRAPDAAGAVHRPVPRRADHAGPDQPLRGLPEGPD